MPREGTQPPPTSAPRGRNLEWFRPDPRPRLIRIWSLGVLTLFIGVGCCAVGFMGLRSGSAASEAGSTGLLLAGVIVVALSMVMTVRRALFVLADETCLILRVDGVCFERAGRATLVPWEVIDAVRADGPALIIDTDDPALGQIRMASRFLGISASALAERVERTRRRALMNLF